MHLVKPGWNNISMGIVPWKDVNGLTVLKHLELIGRKSYKSEDKITEDSAIGFIKARLSGMIKHTAIIDHLQITAEYMSDRGVSHEWLRHKLTDMLGEGCVEPIDDFKPMAAMQESTRYCNYMKRGGVCFVIPERIKNIPEGEYNALELHQNVNSKERKLYDSLPDDERLWFMGKIHSEHTYTELLKNGWTPQEARGDLCIAVKTEFIVTCSLTEWRHVMTLRTDNAAHPDMKEIMRPQLLEFKRKIPVIFDDIYF